MMPTGQVNNVAATGVTVTDLIGSGGTFTVDWFEPVLAEPAGSSATPNDSNEAAPIAITITPRRAHRSSVLDFIPSSCTR
jgi:hypothetical protein